jgi:phospholipid/cholesterol/gamma-HCH transport system ATP-binding protein
MLDKDKKGIVATGTPEELRDRSEIPWVRQFLSQSAMKPPSDPPVG